MLILRSESVVSRGERLAKATPPLQLAVSSESENEFSSQRMLAGCPNRAFSCSSPASVLTVTYSSRHDNETRARHHEFLKRVTRIFICWTDRSDRIVWHATTRSDRSNVEAVLVRHPFWTDDVLDGEV
jgi:hypothetical protein